MPETSASQSEPDPPAAPKPPEPPAPPAPPAPPTVELRREQITDPERMKALAHPARMAVFDHLGARRVQGFDGATATEMAEIAQITPSAMSYHLRTLAKAGFIEEAPGRGDGRERLWRLAVSSFSIQAEEGAPESARVAETAMATAFADQQERAFRRWLAHKGEQSPELRGASVMSSSRLRLTPDEAKRFQERFHALETEYAELTRERVEADADDGALVFDYLFRLYPNL